MQIKNPNIQKQLHKILIRTGLTFPRQSNLSDLKLYTCRARKAPLSCCKSSSNNVGFTFLPPKYVIGLLTIKNEHFKNQIIPFYRINIYLIKGIRSEKVLLTF